MRGALFGLLLRLCPVGGAVVVHGWRDGEENSLRVAAELVRRRGPASVVLLCEQPESARRLYRLVAGGAPDPRLLVKNSTRGVWAFLRAPLVACTHGLFGNPTPGRRRLHVLLGHGHGPKSAHDPEHPLRHRAQLATTNNETWGRAVIADQGIGQSRVRVSGNPREDAFFEPVERSRLTRLGLDPGRPVVAWLPTYRTERRLDSDPRARHVLAELVASCGRSGVQLVTKVHQLDPVTSSPWGVRQLTTSELTGAGLSFYQLLALCDAMVSDYSSVWVDFLLRDRPVGLLLSDIESYRDERGLNEPQIDQVAAELVLSTSAEVSAFLERVQDPAPDPAVGRVAERIGLLRSQGRTRRTVDAIEAARPR